MTAQPNRPPGRSPGTGPSRLDVVWRVLRWTFRSGWDLFAVVPVALVVFAFAALLIRPRSGSMAMALVVEPHLFIVVLVTLTPVAVLGRARSLAVALVVTLVAGGFFFGSEWISLPGSGAVRHDLSVLSWNVEFGERSPAEQAAQLEPSTADIIDLQELEPDAAAAIEGDAVLTARYPYRAMAPRWGPWGLAVLSRYPISEVVSTVNPSCLDLAVATPRGRVHIIAAHPNPPALESGYDPSTRDAEIATLRPRIEAALATGDRLLVLGDFNTAPTEAEYRFLTAGLRDTHVEVGEGPGWTWRGTSSAAFPIGLLRIDLQLTGGAIYPASTWIDCSLRGDHCRLFGDYEIDE